MSNPTAYELIAAVIDDGLSNTVMDAARLAGCRGGTLVKARETGGAASRTLFGLTMAEEREILFILVPSADKKTVMNAISQTILRETGEHGTVFSMPVDAVAALPLPSRRSSLRTFHIQHHPVAGRPLLQYIQERPHRHQVAFHHLCIQGCQLRLADLRVV